MRAPHATLPRFAATVSCLAFVVALSLLSSADGGDTIRVWVVGSPHTGETPTRPAALHLREEFSGSGYRLDIETFPAHGFATTFSEAVARNYAPDVLVFDNFGVMDGITTRLGRFEGIGRNPMLREQFVKVTGAFDELLGPARGWTYLFASSPNHTAARALALKAPQCPEALIRSPLESDLGRIVSLVAKAYLEEDTIGVQAHADPERLPTAQQTREITTVASVRPCGAAFGATTDWRLPRSMPRTMPTRRLVMRGCCSFFESPHFSGSCSSPRATRCRMTSSRTMRHD